MGLLLLLLLLLLLSLANSSFEERSGSKVLLAGAIPPLQAEEPALQGGEAFTQLDLCLPSLPHPLSQVLLGKVLRLLHLPFCNIHPLCVLLGMHLGLHLPLQLSHLLHHLLHLVLPPLCSQLKAANLGLEILHGLAEPVQQHLRVLLPLPM